MPKKNSSSPVKMILIVVAALVVGAALTVGALYFVGKQNQKQQARLLEKDQKITQLAPLVDQAFNKVAQLADQKKVEDAQVAGQEALAKLDEIIALNQEIIDGTSGKQQEIANSRQEVFTAQKKALAKLVECIAIPNLMTSDEGKACQEEFMQLAQELQAKLEEFKKVTGMVPAE